MKKIYLLFHLFFLFGFFFSARVFAQLTATTTVYESRCAATGAIKIEASGGSGSYQYKVTGPVNTNYTGQDSITGLSSGSYSVIVNDINTNETITQTGVVVTGSYKDPRYTLNHQDITCDNGYDGSISLAGPVLFGREPFSFSIVSPSPMGVGTTNSTGTFTGLKAGDYTIRMTDSCGGIQTRTATINNYTWWIDDYDFNKTSCRTGSGFVSIRDSKGRNSKYGTIPGFRYGAVPAPGDTIWSADGNFINVYVTGLRSVSVDLIVKDPCGKFKKVFASFSFVPKVDASVNIFNKTCTKFSAKVTGVKNFFPASYSLYDGGGTFIRSNSTGQFDNLAYGNYCIRIHDGCTDTTIERCFSQSHPIPSVSNNVNISNKNCTDFSASIVGQQNLTNPTYCLQNSLGVEIGCNSTGQFNNLAYGDYCITIKDGCIDTTITRCFSAHKPRPRIDDPIVPSYTTCSNFGLDILSQSDSIFDTNPTICLFDSDGNPIGSCNNTGIFDSIPFGTYYVTIHDGCYDTTIRRDFTVNVPTINNDVNVSISDRVCTTFTATASSSNLDNPEYCLYKSSDSTLITCNTTGVFPGILYGDYYISSRNSCPDTTMLTSFSVSRGVPSVNSTVEISNKTCTDFTAKVTDWVNLVNAEFCLIDTVSKDTLGCNSTGLFNNVPFGSYKIQIATECNDTLIVPFNQSPDSIRLSVSSSKSCTFGYSQFDVEVDGALPVHISIYAPDSSLVKEGDFNDDEFTMDSLPPLNTGESYMVVATDPCGNKDTVNVVPVVGYLTHTPTVVSKCPGSVWPNGSGNINTIVTTNLWNLNVRIIKKDGSSVNINPSYASGNNYTFNDLGPATYIIRYQSSTSCPVNLYDTVTISDYQYPNLTKSAAYQCDVSGFRVGAVAVNGVGPFTYEIIGSVPNTPSIIAPPQADPVFNIDNGTTYSLIRLRALDACGNATLGDVSIFPLANNGMKASANCFTAPSVLSVDTVYNSVYSWYFKKTAASPDSSLSSSGYNYNIQEVMPEDTGIYICYVNVYNGCINRTYSFHLDGSCFGPLPVVLNGFQGQFINEKVKLEWKINNTNDLDQIIIERKINNGFVEIGKVAPHLPSENNQYQFFDENPAAQNFYRLKLIKKDNDFSYSNIVLVQRQFNSGIAIYPNPASDIINVVFYQSNNHTYRISLINILNQVMKDFVFDSGNSNSLQIKRQANMPDGIYILRFTDTNTNEQFSQKIVFGSK